MANFKVRDFRNKGFFVLDDVYLNGYAKHLGTTASMVYISLCRHADKKQKSFPSQELIAEELGVHERTVMRKIATLKKWKLISVKKVKNKSGKWLNNTYFLLDKSEWIKPPTQNIQVDKKTKTTYIKDTQPPTQNIHIKDTHKKDTHNNIIADTQQFPQKAFKRLKTDKQKPVHRLGYYLEDTLNTSIVNWGKQAKAVGMMLKAGYTEDQIKRTITAMATKDDFFSDKGFDLMTVANQIGRYKAEAYKNGIQKQ